MYLFQRRARATLALAALTSTLGTVIAASPASAAPDRADLTVGLTVDRTRIPVQGEDIKADVTVANAGVATAEGVTVTVDLPAGVHIGGEGPLGGDWQCVLSPTMVCTHAALAPGESAAPMSFWVSFGPGADGQAGDIVTTVTSTSRESSTRNNTARQTITHDAGVAYPDLYVTNVSHYPGYEVLEGDWIKHAMHVGNDGTRTADDVRVRVVAQAGLLWGVGDQSDPSWQCTTVVDRQEWECVNGPLAPGEQTPILTFSGEVPAGGQPGDRLPVDFTVSTSTPDEDPRRNTYQGGFVYGTPAYLTGRVWLDADRDGQRDPEEANLLTGEVDLTLQPTGDSSRSVTLNADGTYRLALHYGEYRIQADLTSTTHRFADPNVGDDATDSDVVVIQETPEWQQAQTDPVWGTEGAETVLDIGVVTVG